MMRHATIGLALVVVLAASARAQTVIHVDGDSPNNGPGNDWEHAYRDVQDALGAASPGDEVRVAGATYYPSIQTVPGAPRTEAFQLISGVAIRGGYRGCPGGDCGSGDPDERNIVLYETILSCDLNGDDDPMEFPAGPSYAENCYHVFYHPMLPTWVDPSAVLDGFTITAGNANSMDSTLDKWGGGMLNEHASPTLINCTFKRNVGKFGGGMYNLDQSRPLLIGCVFSGNFSFHEGGGIYNDNGSETSLVNCVLSGNAASTWGGAIYGLGANANLINCTLVGNSGTQGGGVYNGGGSVTLANSVLWGNTPDQAYAPYSVTYSLVHGAALQPWFGEGCIDDLPLLADADGLDDIFGTDDDDVRLLAGSPGIDAGNNTSLPPDLLDLDGDGDMGEPHPFDRDDHPRFMDDPDTPDSGIGTAPIVDMGAYEYWSDCNENGTPDAVDIADSTSEDCNENRIPDECDISDCDGSLWCSDCNDNGAPDLCDLQIGTSQDCNGNGVPDECDIVVGTSEDCNTNDVPDLCDVYGGTSWDCNENVIPDECEPGGLEDCNTNDVPDLCDIYDGTAEDCNDNGILDECEPDEDCNSNEVQDICDIAEGTSGDCNGNGTPDECEASVLHIDDDAPAGGDGLTWDAAFRYLGSALTIAAEADCTVTEIRVAEGTYRPDESAGDPNGTGDRTSTFQLISGVAVRGGYAGYGAADPDERHIVLHETVLSGDIGIIGDNGDNSHHVVTGSAVDSSAVLDGFTVTAGNAVGGPVDGGGGGMYNLHGSPTVTHCTFSGNSTRWDGGGMCNEGSSSPTVTHCTFTGNSADTWGGGMCNRRGSSPTVTNCTFSGNTADGGAGMTNEGGSPKVANCTFTGNSANVEGGGLANYGGSPTVTNCILWGNRDPGGSDESAQIYTYGGTVVNNCCVQGWTGALGGAGNIGDDPGFAFSGDVHLVAGSPCIDAGTNDPPGGLPSSDRDGNARPLDGDEDGEPIADMGAYEFNPFAPSIAVSPRTVEFFASEGEANPSDQTVSIRNCGGGMLNWELAEDCPWVQADPVLGGSDGEVDEVTLSVDITGLAHGENTCVLTVSDEQAVNSPQTVVVVLYVNETLHVPAEYTTIQEAIDASVHGDVVLVADGTYTGQGNKNLDFGGRRITVRSENGSETCVIDCEGDGRAFHFHSGEQETSVVDGFTITNGFADDSGGGMYNDHSGPTVTRCTFIGNSADYGGGMYNLRANPSVTNCTFGGNTADNGVGGGVGGGMCSDFSRPTVTNCTFSENAAGEQGGGMSNRGRSSPTVTNCTFSENTANAGGGMYNDYYGSSTVTNCIFTRNSAHRDGGGMGNYSHSSPSLANCTFSGNVAGGSGGGMYNADSSPTVTNCILWGNGDSGGSDESAQVHAGTPVIDYSCVQGWTGALGGAGNIGDNHGFAFSDDVHLVAGSPCIDAGTGVPPGGLTPDDFDGNARPLDGDENGEAIADMGAYEFNPLAPSIAVSPPTVVFCALEGGPHPGAETLSIRNCGGRRLNWEVAEDCPWVQADPAIGDSDGEVDEVTLGVDLTSLAQGEHTCVLTVSDEQAVNSPQIAVVVLYVGVTRRVPAEYTTIQEAIDASVHGDVVLVADGTYTGQGNKNLDFGGRKITVRSENGPETCVIDCEGDGRGFHFHSGEQGTSVVDGFTITNGSADYGGGMRNDRSSPTVINCIFSVNSAGDDGGGLYNWCCSPTVINSTFSDNSAAKGGGMYNGYSDPTATDCTLSGNLAAEGGGMYNRNSSPKVAYSTFSANAAQGSGGGMYNYDYSTPNVTQCTFHGNTAQGPGGGMYNGRSDPTVTNSTFSENSAAEGGGIYNLTSSPNVAYNAFTANAALGPGGGMCNHNNSSPNVANCTFVGNSAQWYGGGMNNDSYSSPTVTNSTFSANSAQWDGGGMYNSGYSIPTVTHCTFSGNSADYGGGGMCNNAESSPTVTNSTFSGNSAQWDGGGMYNDHNSSPTVANCIFTGNSAHGDGGGMGNYYSSSPSLTNCTFAGNLAGGSGGGMYYTSRSPALTNCILWGDTPNEIYGPPSAAIAYSCVQDDDPDDGSVYPGVGNTDDDPLFVRLPDDGGDGWGDDPDTPDIDEGANDDYGDTHLQLDSPCINTGDATALPADSLDLDGDGDHTEPIPIDLDRHARVLCGEVDMGAYEFGIGDFDCNEAVNLFDFAEWEGCMTGPDAGPYDPGCEPFDSEYDGDVDSRDFALFQRQFTGSP